MDPEGLQPASRIVIHHTPGTTADWTGIASSIQQQTGVQVSIQEGLHRTPGFRGQTYDVNVDFNFRDVLRFRGELRSGQTNPQNVSESTIFYISLVKNLENSKAFKSEADPCKRAAMLESALNNTILHELGHQLSG